MCRSIKTLRQQGGPAADDEVRAAALQFVRKVSGYRQPSAANSAAFEDAVEHVTASTRELLDSLVPPRSTANRPATSRPVSRQSRALRPAREARPSRPSPRVSGEAR